MAFEKTLKLAVEQVEPGKLKGQWIATAQSSSEKVVFDVIEGLLSLKQGDVIEITVTDTRPGNLDPYDFCGHGYLVKATDEKEIFSIWGILFIFEPPIGLKDNVKYYLCIRKI